MQPMVPPTKVKKYHKQYTEYNNHYQSTMTSTYQLVLLHMHTYVIIQFLAVIACRFWWTHQSGTQEFHPSGERSKCMRGHLLGWDGHHFTIIPFLRTTTTCIRSQKLIQSRIEWPEDLEVIMKSTRPSWPSRMHTPDLLSALHYNVCIVTQSTDIVDAHSKHMGLQQETMLIKSQMH